MRENIHSTSVINDQSSDANKMEKYLFFILYPKEGITRLMDGPVCGSCEVIALWC